MSEEHLEEKKTALSLDDPLLRDLEKCYGKRYLAKLELTEDDLANIHAYVDRFEFGSSSTMPLVCTGMNGCMYKQMCPLVNKPPLAMPCVFERMMIERWTQEYIQDLAIDPKKKVERSQLTDLVEADLTITRANAVIAGDSFIMDNPVGTDPDTGQVVYRKEEHIAVNVKDRALNRRDKILKAFIATRDAKLKGLKGLGTDDDITNYLSSLKRKAVDMRDIQSGTPVVEGTYEHTQPPELGTTQSLAPEQGNPEAGRAEDAGDGSGSRARPLPF